MNDEIMKEALEKEFPKSDHIFEELDLDQWEQAGKPYCWLLAQQSNEVTLMSDCAYGYLALFVNNELVSVGKDFVHNEDLSIIGLSEYYGVEKATLYKKMD